MRCSISLLVGVWASVAMPCLCTAGWFTHPCESHETDGCGHESDCPDDPCAKFTSAPFPAGSRLGQSHSDNSLLQPVFFVPTIDFAQPARNSRFEIGSRIEHLLTPGAFLPLLI